MKDKVRICFGPLKIRMKMNKLKSRSFRASSLSTYDFCSLYTTPPHNLIKENSEGSLYLAMEECFGCCFSTSEKHRNYTLWSYQKVYEALTFLLDNIYVRFGPKLFRQSVNIPTGTNYAPLVADLFLLYYERLHDVSF